MPRQLSAVTNHDHSGEADVPHTSYFNTSAFGSLLRGVAGLAGQRGHLSIPALPDSLSSSLSIHGYVERYVTERQTTAELQDGLQMHIYEKN